MITGDEKLDNKVYNVLFAAIVGGAFVAVGSGMKNMYGSLLSIAGALILLGVSVVAAYMVRAWWRSRKRGQGASEKPAQEVKAEAVQCVTFEWGIVNG